MKTRESGSAMCQHCGAVLKRGDEMREHKFTQCELAMAELEKLIYRGELGQGFHLYESTSTVIPRFRKRAEKFRGGANS